MLLSPSASTAIFFFRSSASDLIFLLPGLISSSTSCSSIGQRAGARRDLGVGAQHRKVGLPAIERGERLGAVGVGHDLETQPRVVVLEHRGEPGGETGLQAVAVADGEDQRFGIPQPDAAAPCDGRDRQDQCQGGKQQHLPAVASDNLRARGFSAFGVGTSALMAHTRTRKDDFA